AVDIGDQSGGEPAAAYRHVQGDDVLEVEQVGVLCRGHDRAGRVDQLTPRPIAVREHGEDPADAQQPGGDQCHQVAGVLAAVFGTQAGDDQVRVRGDRVGAVEHRRVEPGGRRL